VVQQQYRRVTEGLTLLATMPRIGREVHGRAVHPNLRAFVLRDTSLQAFYRATRHGIRVQRLRHIRQAPL
jgi:plasmid stabilization system protein ParE